MASLMYAKESILLKGVCTAAMTPKPARAHDNNHLSRTLVHFYSTVLQDVADNDKRTQTLELSGSNIWKGKSAALTASLADALLNNSKLTALNMSDCNLGDKALMSLDDSLKYNSTLFDLNLSHNKLGRPGLQHLASCLTTEENGA